MRNLKKGFQQKKDEALSGPNVQQDWIIDKSWSEWEAPLNIVRGEFYHKKPLESLVGSPRQGGYFVPVKVTLCREPSNKHDSNAIRAEVEGKLVGYIAKEVAAALSPALDSVGCVTFSVAGIICGGSKADDNLECHVWVGRRLSPGPLISFAPKMENSFKINWPPDNQEGGPS